MRSYLLTFDFVQSNHDQSTVADRNTEVYRVLLDEFNSCQTLLVQWAIRSDMTAEEIRDRIRPMLGVNDRIVVSELLGTISHLWTLGDFTGWMQGKAEFRTIEQWKECP